MPLTPPPLIFAIYQFRHAERRPDYAPPRLPIFSLPLLISLPAAPATSPFVDAAPTLPAAVALRRHRLRLLPLRETPIRRCRCHAIRPMLYTPLRRRQRSVRAISAPPAADAAARRERRAAAAKRQRMFAATPVAAAAFV